PLIQQSLKMDIIHKLLFLRYSCPPISHPHKKTVSVSLSQKPPPVPEVPGKRLFSHLEIPEFPLLPLPPERPGTGGGHYSSTARHFSSCQGREQDNGSDDCRPGSG